jgi:hypothetical protein
VANYDWDEQTEIEGRFWVPGSAERFYGRLNHDPRDGSKVHFYDVPAGDPSSRDSGLAVDSRVFGELTGRLPVTLDGFFPIQWTATGLPAATTAIDGMAQSVVFGRHLPEAEELTAHGFSARLHGLEATLNGAHGEGGLLNPHRGSEPRQFSSGDSRQIDLPDGAALTLHSGEAGSVSPGVTHTEVRSSIHVSVPTALQSSKLESTYLDPIRDFVIFCTRRLSYVRSLTFHDQQGYNGIPVLKQPWPYPRLLPGNQYRLGLNLARVQAPDDLIRRWFSLRQDVGAVWLLLFTTMGTTEGLLENRFLNFLAFIEGYHRAVRDKPPLSKKAAKDARDSINAALESHGPEVRELFAKRLSHANSQDQRERLFELATDAKDLLGNHWNFDPVEQCRAMVDTRNWMTHWGSRTKYVADDPSSLASFCRHLELIAYVAILRELDLDSDDIALAIGNGWVLDNLLE